MSRPQTDRHALVRAAIASLALHLLAVPLFAVVGGPRGTGTARALEPTNETTHVAYFAIESRSARPVTARRPVAKGIVAIISQRHWREPSRIARPRAAPAPSMKALPAGRRARSLRASRPNAPKDPFAPGSAAAAQRIARAALALTMQTPAPERSVTPEAPRVPASVQPATATEAPLAIVAARQGEIPPGGWGQSFANPLVADEDILATLRAKYRGVRTIAIDVDASGRATHVTLPESVTGEARAELARQLLALHYVPAECNGLRCTGTLELAL